MFRPILISIMVALSLCASASAEVITPTFSRSNFSANPIVTNPYDPLVPGTVLRYAGKKEGQPETARFEVTHERKTILGVRTTVIHDRGFVNGKLRENTYDWYAQDKKGNVWYFGEATEELSEKGERENTDGSWLAGRPVGPGGPRARPGIFMPDNPVVGTGFKQELAPEVSEDEFEVENLNASVSTPYITTNRTLQTNEFTPLEPGTLDHKYFALGIGDVVEETVIGSEDKIELVDVERP